MGKMSQRKGRGGELEICRILQDYGIPAEPGQAVSYGNTPDVVGIPGVHPEIKRAERLNVPAAFINTLRVYSDFGLTMSLAEIKGLMAQADGNYTALRALGSVAAKSGFWVAVPPVEAYQEDIERIERWARIPILYAPMDYLHEALELWPRAPIFGKDGAIHGERPNSSVSLLAASAGFSELVKSIKDTKERWGMAFIPEISAFKPVENEDDETITPEQQREDAVAQGAAQIAVEQEDKTISHAREIGQQRANDRANAIEGIKRFVVT